MTDFRFHTIINNKFKSYLNSLNLAKHPFNNKIKDRTNRNALPILW